MVALRQNKPADNQFNSEWLNALSRFQPSSSLIRFDLLEYKMEIRPYQETDELPVVRLWTDCGLVVQWNNPNIDIERKLKVQREMFLVGIIDGKIVATAMAGYEGHRGWINYLAVHPDYQGSGIGRLIMEEAEKLLREIGCPKINLLVRATNVNVIGFYQKIGYKIDDVVSLGKRLVPDE